MSDGEERPSARDRLYACDGVSVTISYGAHPPGVVSPAGHLGIQTSGYAAVDLDRVLPILRDLPETFDLEFLGDVSDGDLRHLAGLQNVLKLGLGHGRITDDGLRHLSGLTRLRVLDLSGKPVTGEGVRHLAGLTELRALRLGWTRADDEAMGALAGLTHLTDLDLTDCPVTDVGLGRLAGLRELESLCLRGTRVTGAGLAAVARLGSLKRLDLSGLPVGDADTEYLAALRGLQCLSLSNTRAGDRGAEWLSRLGGVGQLYLDGTRMTDDTLRHLRACPALTYLSLDGTAVTGTGLRHLPAGLTGLGLRDTPLGPEMLDGLRHLECLSSLYIDAAVARGPVLGLLRGLGLGPAGPFDEGIAAFRRFPACPLCEGPITEEDAAYAARPFPLEADLYRYVKVPIHWDCFARWEQRPRFASQYFAANVRSAGDNRFWGVARCDERVLVTVNPAEFVKQIDVLLAETASSFRVHLDDWQDWLAGEWFEGCRHEAERDALGPVIPSLRDGLPTPEAVVEAAGMSSGETGQDAGGTLNPAVGRIMYEIACRDLAERAARKGLACPQCGEFSDDYDYRAVETVSPDGPQSRLVCKGCGADFGPSDA